MLNLLSLFRSGQGHLSWLMPLSCSTTRLTAPLKRLSKQASLKEDELFLPAIGF